MAWKKVKTKFANEDRWEDKVLGFISIIDDYNGAYHDYVVESNNKEFNEKTSGYPFRTKKQAVAYARGWMARLSKGLN
jgi:hypothetical protein